MAPEYGFITETINLKPEMITAASASGEFAALLGQFSETLTRLSQSDPDGPFEVVSHNLTILRPDLALLSFLIRR